MTNLLLTAAVAALVANAPDPAARALLDTAAARMGGATALRSVQRLRVESMTEWQRTTLDNRAHAAVSSYEWSTELRDYANPAWRYTRRFLGPAGWQEVIDLVVDSVAAIRVNGKWGPQNVAYVDERSEVFTFSPERLMRFALDATDARAMPDTTIARQRYARVRVSVNGFFTTLHFGRTDGALALASFRAAQEKDFGLAAWGEMDVAIWYSRWQRMREVPISMPTQMDIYRVGRPYKRVTYIAVGVNTAFAPESLSMSDSLRVAFLAAGGKAMYDLPVDTARVVNDRFAVFGTPGTPAGAILLGGRWLMIEAGTAPMSIERSAAFLAKGGGAAPLAGALVTQPSGQGGIVWVAAQKLPLWVSPGARTYTEATLRGWKSASATVSRPASGWMRVGSDSLLVESIDLPDFPATAVVYVPSLRWVYAAAAASPLVIERISALATQRKWAVDRIGSARNFVGVPGK